jgi:hypothetical protein
VAKLLREIKWPRWIPEADGLPRPATALRDMYVDEKRRLSVWFLSDANRDADLNRLAVALTVRSGHCENFSYGLVDMDALSSLNLRMEQSPGRTVDSDVNQLHRDIVDPSVEQLAAITLKFVPADTIYPRAIGKLIAGRLNAHSLTRLDLPDDIEEKLIKWDLLELEPHSEDLCQEARQRLGSALDAWQRSVDAYRAAVATDPAAGNEKYLAAALSDCKTAVEEALKRARRVWRSHPTPA